MKRRRKKAYTSRHILDALRAEKRERGDHRRWMWMATFPQIIDDAVLGKCEITFHPLYGRCYRPLSLGGT